MAFNHPLSAPGCHRQPEIHTAAGMISNTAVPMAIRRAIDSIFTPYSLSAVIITENAYFAQSGKILQFVQQRLQAIR
jgi:hypothetical protein